MLEPPVEKVNVVHSENLVDLIDVINKALLVLEPLGETYSAGCDDLKLLQQRMASGRFYLAVLGQF
ncbi:MAG: hypothetical protein KAU22_09820, partial [Desulfuromonadales bacterium]|nr:hypothetical protein [Desulfuromonadales bacterium]